MRRSAALFLGLLLAGPVPASDVPRLVKQLGSPDFRAREAASKELESVGEPALPALRVAATSADHEVAWRAAGLVGRITRKAENDRLLAPTLVELAFRDAPVADVLAAVEKQSGYRLVVADPGGSAARVTVSTAGRVPFWDAVAAVADATGLEYRRTASRDELTADPFRRAVEARQVIKHRRAELDVLENYLVLERQLDRRGRTQEKAEAARANRLQVEKQAAVCRQSLAEAESAVRAREVERRWAVSLLRPFVVLARPTGDRRPAVTTGAARVSAGPSAAGRAGFPADVVPVVVHIAPEPKLGPTWVRSVRVTTAVDEAGRSLAALPAEDGFAPSEVPWPVRLKVSGPSPARLATLEGVVRAVAWPGAEELAAVEDPGAERFVTGRAGVSLRVEVIQATTSGRCEIAVTVRYDPRVVRPVGEDKLVGLTVTGADGRPFGLQLLRIGQVLRATTDPDRETYEYHVVLAATPPGPGPSRPARVSFRGARPVTVEVPFKLSNVPVAAGTGPTGQ